MDISRRIFAAVRDADGRVTKHLTRDDLVPFDKGAPQHAQRADAIIYSIVYSGVNNTSKARRRVAKVG